MDITPSLANAIKRGAVPLINKGVSSKAPQNYARLLEAVGDAEVVMIGEASHGTHDFYQQRAEITKQLIEKKGFTFVAVEADWPDAYRVNRYVQNGRKSDKTVHDSVGDFRRFPLWMWRNTVMMDFIQWLRSYNDKLEDKIAFYGMDLYSFYSSMDAVIEYLEQVSPEDAKLAKKRYANFDRFQGEPSSYGMAAGFGLSKSFEREVVSTLVDLQKKEELYLKGAGGLIDGDELFYTQQNARIVKNAEEYYRKMYHADEVTWNLRDSHMAECVESLFDYHKNKFQGTRKEKVVLWAHNSHLGDARATDASRRGELNVGQLMREKYGFEKTFNIGFSTFQGSVTAAKNWDEAAQCDRVRNGLFGSYEHVLHAATSHVGSKDYYLLFRSNNPNLPVDAELVSELTPSRYERYIGVIYRPDTEKASHYCKSSLPKEFDCVIFMDETHAVEPLDRTVPWENEYAIIRGSKVVDPYPELEEQQSSGYIWDLISSVTNILLRAPKENVGTVLGDELLAWRLKAAEQLNELGAQLLLNKDYDTALQKLDKAVKYVENNLSKYQKDRNLQDLRCKILINKAEAHYHLGQWNGVINACDMVNALKPSTIQSHLLIARAYEKKGFGVDAKHHFDIAAKLSADQPAVSRKRAAEEETRR